MTCRQSTPFPFHTRCSFALAIGLLLAANSPITASPQHQGDQSDHEPMATEKDEVLVEATPLSVPTSNTIATKLPTPVEGTPTNVGVVSGTVLEEQNGLVLGDALKNISGVNVQTGQGVFDFFVVRGFDSLSSGLILVDGAPELETTFYQLYNVERVELLKGPGGFLYGPNPLAGAANLVRKQPLQNDFGEVSVAGGSHDTWEGTIDLNRAGSDGNLAFRLNGLWRQTDGYRDGREGEVGAVNPAFTWRPSERSSLNVNLEFLSSDYMPDAGLPVLLTPPAVDLPRERSYASPFDRSEQDLGRLQIDYEIRLSERLLLRNKAYWRQLDWTSTGTLLGPSFFTLQGNRIVTRSLLQLDDLQESIGNQLELITSIETGSIRHRLLTGIEISRLQDDYTLDVGLLPPIDLVDPVETAREDEIIPIPNQSAAGDSRADLIAPYLIDEISFSDRLRLFIGARYDNIDFEDDVSQTRRSDGELSPMLGGVIDITASTSLYASFARSFSPPSARVVGDRDPEESEQVEVGLRQRLNDDRLRLTLAAFEIERQNIAIPDDNGFTQQEGDQEAQGIEIDLTWDLGGGMISLFSYAYTDSELTRFAETIFLPQPPGFVTVDRSGNRSAFAPEHVANLWLSKTVFSDLTLSAGLRYVGKQFIAEDNVTELEDYVLLDLGATYRYDHWQLGLFLSNLTDEEYDTRGFGGYSVIPGEPFTATVRLKYRF